MHDGRRWVGFVLGLSSLWVLSTASAETFDPSSRFGFELRTRWGTKLEGVFPRYEGEVKHLQDGRHQVVLRMFTQSVEIVDHPRYTDWTRSEKFFEADRYPVVTFISKPYDAELLKHGGPLAGDLSIRGITRPKTLAVAPSACARPAHRAGGHHVAVVRRAGTGGRGHGQGLGAGDAADAE
ncbi:MAG: polyisoprenoid-binding protein, partial [Rubrivivax sp.]